MVLSSLQEKLTCLVGFHFPYLSINYCNAKQHKGAFTINLPNKSL